jgi:beta-xylosidase
MVQPPTFERRDGAVVRRAALAWLVVAAVLAGCGSGSSAECSSAARFTNPVFRSDFPDPFVLRVNGVYHAYATNSVQDNVQTLRSRDLVHWTRGHDAMPNLASWILRGRTWAPEVQRLSNNKYVLYFTARSFDLGAQCVGRAVATSPTGPFLRGGSKPLVCQQAQGGSIDPSPFRDSTGTLYLLWKNDGNCCGKPTYIYVQRLSDDGLRLVGKRTRIERNDAAWEGTTVEAPTMWKEDGRYFLFYSANVYNTSFYAVGYAACRHVTGPCSDSTRNPILSSACRAAGLPRVASGQDRGGDAGPPALDRPADLAGRQTRRRGPDVQATARSLM